MSIEFPLLSKHTDFGTIPDVLIPIEVLTKYGYQTIQFVLDTGADFTMLPHHMAEVIGLDLSQCPTGHSYGIEGKAVRISAGKIKIKIGGIEFKIRCLFSEKEDTPYLLGRADIFTKFNILFDNQNNKIKFNLIKE